MTNRLEAQRGKSAPPSLPNRGWLVRRAGTFHGAWMGLLLGWLGAGCESVRFYGQAVRGHGQVMFQRQPIAKVVAQADGDAELVEQLELVLALREYADGSLDLPAHKHYLSYVDLKRSYVVWDVYAAPEFSLEPKTWWYPVVGRMSYRGYFEEASARSCAERLRRQGWDVFVGGVEAYSTLGWFNDPVLNTFIDRPASELADLIFHELAHQKIFVRGDTEFNEAFATAVAREGVRRWLRARNQPDLLRRWEMALEQDDAFVALILKTRRHLERVYADGQARRRRGEPLGSTQTAVLRARKEEVFRALREDYEQLKRRWGGWGGYDSWFDHPVNNARLNAEATYYQWLPAFEHLLASLDGDLPRFYKAVRQLGKLAPDQRKHQLARISRGARSLVRGP